MSDKTPAPRKHRPPSHTGRRATDRVVPRPAELTALWLHPQTQQPGPCGCPLWRLALKPVLGEVLDDPLRAGDVLIDEQIVDIRQYRTLDV